MALESMTGFGQAAGEADGWGVKVYCKSVNHRSLDVRLQIPRECAWLEQEAVGLVRQRVGRGRIAVKVELDMRGAEASGRVRFIDHARFRAVRHELEELAQATATGPVSLADVLAFRHVFEVQTIAEIEDGEQALVAIVEAAIDQLVACREREGRGIVRDMVAHLADLEGALEELAAMLAGELDALRRRLAQRVREAVAEFGVGELTEERLAEELAYYADKSDVAEELQRAGSHVQALRELVRGSGGRALGKKIDFYLQELVRETNTMGSKTRSASTTDLVIEMKSTVEKMREQAANIA